jgi:uncharacterized protein (TIGR03086 family)
MTAHLPAPSLVGGLGLLERAMGYTLGSLLLVKPEDLGRRTPCTEWNLRELLLHMNDSLAALHEAADTGYVDMQPLAPSSPAVDLVGSLRDRACQLLGAWTSRPEGDIAIADLSLAAGMVAWTGALEVCVHGWDVAVGCGAHRPVPRDLALELLDAAPLLVSARDRPGRFADPVTPPVGSEPGTQLLAWLGRDVQRWTGP